LHTAHFPASHFLRSPLPIGQVTSYRIHKLFEQGLSG
jgi:hypothetical protein